MLNSPRMNLTTPQNLIHNASMKFGWRITFHPKSLSKFAMLKIEDVN